jgi:hypothetical protein
MNTSREYRDASGRLSIDLDTDDRRFMLYASRLEGRLKARLIQKLDGPDQRYWDYDVSGITVVLHCDVFAGVSVHVEDGSHDELLRDLAGKLSTE